jgi:hypothetical protein
VAVFRKTIKASVDASCVTCPKCSCEIPVLGAQRPPREFSVLCPNCGWRKEYLPGELHDARPDAEPAHEIGAIQFGKKIKKIAGTNNIFVPPKGRLNKLVTWLLQ